MSVSLEQLTQILATYGISSSQEEHILRVVKNLTTPPKENEESTYEEPYTFDGDNYMNKREMRTKRSCSMI